MSRSLKLIFAIFSIVLIASLAYIGIQIYTNGTIVAAEEEKVIHEDYQSPQTTSLPPTTTSTVPESEGDSEPTIQVASHPVWVDLPSADRLIIPSVGTNVEAVPTGDGRVNSEGEVNNPADGTVDYFVSGVSETGERGFFVEPGELGMALLTAHTNSSRKNNNGGVAYEWIDYESETDDSPGIQLGDQVVFTATKPSEIYRYVYEVIEWPEMVLQGPLPIKSLGDTPALYYPKGALSDVANQVYTLMVDQLVLVPEGKMGLLVLSTSYGGPSGKEYKANGYEKYYNAVLLAELVDIVVIEIE